MYTLTCSCSRFYLLSCPLACLPLAPVSLSSVAVASWSGMATSLQQAPRPTQRSLSRYTGAQAHIQSRGSGHMLAET